MSNTQGSQSTGRRNKYKELMEKGSKVGKWKLMKLIS